MNLLNKLERKFGRYAIPNLIKYIVGLYAVGLLIGMINGNIYDDFLSLDFSMILKGQVWRLITFLIPQMPLTNFLFVLIEIYMYYLIGSSLERIWGNFRFNLYFLSGVLLNIIGAALIFGFTGISISPSLSYINRSMFFAYAALFPNEHFYLYFLIPIKAKYIAIFYGIFMGLDLFRYLFSGNLYLFLFGLTIIISFLNFIIFFFATRNLRRGAFQSMHRKAKFHQQVQKGRQMSNTTANFGGVITRHKCAVCGKTEKDDDQLEFRFCSKCDGNYEYCMDHLFTHEHVQK